MGGTVRARREPSQDHSSAFAPPNDKQLADGWLGSTSGNKDTPLWQPVSWPDVRQAGCEQPRDAGSSPARASWPGGSCTRSSAGSPCRSRSDTPASRRTRTAQCTTCARPRSARPCSGARRRLLRHGPVAAVRGDLRRARSRGPQGQGTAGGTRPGRALRVDRLWRAQVRDRHGRPAVYQQAVGGPDGDTATPPGRPGPRGHYRPRARRCRPCPRLPLLEEAIPQEPAVRRGGASTKRIVEGLAGSVASPARSSSSPPASSSSSRRSGRSHGGQGHRLVAARTGGDTCRPRRR